MVIKSHNYEGRITVITELADKKGYSVIVPVIVEGHGVWQNVNVDTNMIASVYGRKNVIGDMKKAFANNEVLYLDKEKSDLIAQNLGVQFPDTMNEDRSSADIIADLTRAVKGENAENQQKISESSEENADQAQNEGETETVESADGNDGAQADNASDGVRFSLKNESADKVDVDQTLRAGDNSVAEQTETNEQTRHEPVTVTETMRQWADKRAGQIIREYRSAIDGASVREDMAKLVNELAENGASSDALNATVNMAKGIIEKSSRLDNTLRDQYRDLRKNIRETAITLTDTQKQEAANITGSYGRYRQSLMGSVRLVSEGGTPLDTMWTEWSGQYPELFTPGLNEGDQVARLAEIKTMFEPKYINEYGEHLDAAAADLGMRLYSEALKQVGDAARAQQVTQNLNGMRSRYSEATRQALKKVKSDQVARFRQIASELQAARQAGDSARETVSEKLGAPAGMADDIGWACIWQAVKRETEAEHPNIEVGGEAYWNIVRSRFEDVCLRTQVVDTVLTRSQLMRSKSQLMKSVTAFMSEPTKNYNLIRNAVSDMAGLPASGLIADTELKKRPWQHWYKLPGCAYEAKDSGRAQGRRKRSIRIPSR